MDIFKAIADPTRRSIILLLALAPMTPNAVAEQYDMSRQAVSKHLQILAQSGILEYEAKGREVYYHVNTEKMDELENWINEFKQIFSTRFEQLDQVLNQLKGRKQ
jgi:DNA-binding transcriptional ArsR family regulator